MVVSSCFYEFDQNYKQKTFFSSYKNEKSHPCYKYIEKEAMVDSLTLLTSETFKVSRGIRGGWTGVSR